MAIHASLSALQRQIHVYRTEGKRIGLTGGCFDILHLGHIIFLQAAREHVHVLIVLLESDESVKRKKGPTRPFFSQKERATVLAELRSVTEVFLLSTFSSDMEYDRLITTLSPDSIIVTDTDPILEKKQEQARHIHAHILSLPFLPTLSSSKLASLLSQEPV